MSWLLDTNAVSELRLIRRNEGFEAWWSVHKSDERQLFLCAPVLGELMRGALLLEIANARRQALLRWLGEEIEIRFANRVLAFDLEAARTWSRVAASIPKGRVLPVIDSYIAAIAIHHDLTLITRDVADMSLFKELKLVCPWT